MRKRKITERERRQLARWESFLEQQLGAYPSTIAAIKLGMTTTGVYNAADRGWITFFQVGRDRWYGRRDVIKYREQVSKVFRDNRPFPADRPKNFSVGLDNESWAD